MSLFQKRTGDIEYLTQEGIKEISKYDNNYSESTKPIPPKERDWGTWNIMALWIGMLVSIAVYQVASGLIVSGMTWYQALFTIVLGHTLVMIPAVLLGHFGTKYGTSYPLLSKMVFGTKGIVVPTMVRAILGCFWFGVQAWIGGQAVNTILSVFIPSWSNLGFWGMFISFLIFWAINLWIAQSGSKGVKALESYAAPVLIILSFLVIVWGMSAADWSISNLLSVPAVSGGSGDFWALFFPALSSMIAFDGGIALSIADFTRHAKDQKSQIVGQVAGAPFMTAFISFVGICGTAGSAIVFGEAIWEPAILVSKFDNPFIVVIFSVFIMAAVLTTNVAGNLVPPTLIFSTLFSEKLDYKKSALVAAGLGLLSMPWYTMANPENLIFNVLGTLGALLGPITGLYVVAYWFEHKRKVDLVDLYKTDEGKYHYKNGWNKEIVILFIVSTIIIIVSKFIPALHFIFDNSYVIGSIGTGLIYYFLIKSRIVE